MKTPLTPVDELSAASVDGLISASFFGVDSENDDFTSSLEAFPTIESPCPADLTSVTYLAGGGDGGLSFSTG